MKKITLLTIISMTAVLVQAQTNKYKIAFRVSPNVAWAKPDSKYIESGGNVLRFGFGAAVDIHFAEHYAIGTGFELNSMGGELSYLETGQIQNIERIWEKNRVYRLKYLEVPFTLKLRTGEIGYMTYWAQFGLGLGVNLGAKGDDEIDYFKDKISSQGAISWVDSNLASVSSEDEDIKDDIQLFRACMIIAAGVEYNLSGNTSVVAGVTYSNGFTNFMKNNGVKTDDRGSVVYQTEDPTAPLEYRLKAMTNYIALNVGILF